MPALARSGPYVSELSVVAVIVVSVKSV
uniref:Uncharacterized protein n=1 Tax=Anguilla anguilla TaxID=7936 RepID=A0A0E9XAB8_ANGAN